MSGIYIDGMEMPKSPVLFCIHSDGKVFADLEGGWREYKAVEIPSHGRLIDAREFYKAFKKWLVKFYAAYEKDNKDERIAALLELDLAVRMTLEDAPTIIPAEEGDT